MASTKRIHSSWYVFSDYLAAILAWMVLYFIRRYLLEEALTVERRIYLNDRFWWGISLIPLFWLIFYTIIGSYRSLYAKSRLNEFSLTLVTNIIGCTIIFFLIVINDPQRQYTYYYKAFFIFLAAQFIFTWFGRWVILSKVKRQMDSGSVRFNTLLVGGNSIASTIYKDTGEGLRRAGYHYTGFIAGNGHTNGIKEYLPQFGDLSNLEQIVIDKNIRLVVIALDKKEKEQVEKIINRLSEQDVEIKIVADTLDILSGSVKTSNVFGAVLSDIKTGLMPDWQQNIKQVIDVVLALLGLILLSPLFIYTAIRVRLSSAGPIIYSQERMGYKGRIFSIYKFRSMIKDAELNGPRLSSEKDPRITAWGRTMRKWRLDELPQLWNILKGEMSLVGPRPLPDYHLEQFAPEFRQLRTRVLPGLTGLWQVSGRSDVEFDRRVLFDREYASEWNCLLDLKILTRTIPAVLSMRGAY